MDRTIDKTEAKQNKHHSTIRNRLMNPPVYYVDPPVKKRTRPIDMYKSTVPYGAVLEPFTTTKQNKILKVLDSVAKDHGVVPGLIMNKVVGSNTHDVVRARREFAYLLSTDLGLSNFQLSDLLQTDDSTISNMLRLYKKNLSRG